MIDIMYFKNKVLTEKKAAGVAAAQDAFAKEQELIQEFAASYLDPKSTERDGWPLEFLALR
jgi:hypothetical protein